MDSTVVCTIITVSGVVVSALISWIISRQTANSEIEKLRLTWNREDVVSSDEEFAEMAKAVAKYDSHSTYSYQSEAIGLVGAIRSKEHGELGDKLDKLYFVINSEQGGIAEALTDVIEQKRKNKGYTLNSNEQPPSSE